MLVRAGPGRGLVRNGADSQLVRSPMEPPWLTYPCGRDRFEQLDSGLAAGEVTPGSDARRSFKFKASTAFAVYTIRRTSSGNTKNGMTSAQARRQLWPMAGRDSGCPRGPPRTPSAPFQLPPRSARDKSFSASANFTSDRSYQADKQRPKHSQRRPGGFTCGRW